ncbi:MULTISPECIES: hypothetical protein [Paenibacillus]|uniref:Uncharacterized protein n=1 Tax=Paenibacillus vandeheii TaxID=3035917 RepID=A0ABT8JFN5_9BACL|nr:MULTISPECIES: hypothetical protein [Paenibacillus]KGP81381.1 hypothetical protein P363_0128235 [Paenibacillus sp. MAEPY1]KGP82017.1 hypothetical protein P364_0114490 [Paenibacillus sp. MAEPY2]MDN4603938.1 hypothetical protein [Paenibacillus vandeheii]
MDKLVKLVIQKGISLQSRFSYQVKDQLVEYSISDILFDYKKAATLQEYKSTLSHMKSGVSKELALGLLEGIGQRNAIIKVLGIEKYSRLEYTTMTMGLSDQPISFKVIHPKPAIWWIQKKGDKCFLYPEGEIDPEAMTVQEFFKKLCANFDPDDIEIDFVDSATES